MDAYKQVRDNTLGPNNKGANGVAYLLLTVMSSVDGPLAPGVNARRAVLGRLKELAGGEECGGLHQMRKIIGDGSV